MSLSDVLGAVTAASAVAGAITAALALRTWRKQLVGGRRAEVAEAVLTEFYEYKVFFRAARSAAFSSNEFERRERDPDEERWVSDQLDFCFVLLRRFDARSELRARLWGHQSRFKALFGDAEARPFETLFDAESEFLAAVNAVAQLARRGQEADCGLRLKLTNGGGTDDDLDRRVAEAVHGIEKVCRPAIEARERPFQHRFGW